MKRGNRGGGEQICKTCWSEKVGTYRVCLGSGNMSLCVNKYIMYRHMLSLLRNSLSSPKLCCFQQHGTVKGRVLARRTLELVIVGLVVWWSILTPQKGDWWWRGFSGTIQASTWWSSGLSGETQCAQVCSFPSHRWGLIFHEWRSGFPTRAKEEESDEC